MGHHPEGDQSGDRSDPGGGRGPESYPFPGRAGGRAPEPREDLTGQGVGGQAGDAADRASVLAHELNNLLDGSLRWMGLALRGLPDVSPGPVAEELDRVRRQMELVRDALERMAALVSDATGREEDRGLLSAARTATLEEAGEHAAAVVRPWAAELGVTVSAKSAGGATSAPAGPVYSVMLNGLRNAVESIERALGGKPGAGRVELRVWVEGATAVLEIEDDGAGPPTEPERAFEMGWSGREGEGGGAGAGRGIGLALAERLVQELGGSIELAPGEGVETARPGAVLRARWPIGG